MFLPDHPSSPSTVVSSALDLIGRTPLVALDRVYPGPGRVLANAVGTSDDLDAGRMELMMRVHRHFRYDGASLAVPPNCAPAQMSILTPAQVLEQSDLFGVMLAAQRHLLAGQLEVVSL